MIKTDEGRGEDDSEYLFTDFCQPFHVDGTVHAVLFSELREFMNIDVIDWGKMGDGVIPAGHELGGRIVVREDRGCDDSGSNR